MITLRPVKELKLLSKPIHEGEEIPKEVDEPKEEEEAKHHEPSEEVVEPVSDPVIERSSITMVPFLTRLEDKQKKLILDRLDQFWMHLDFSRFVKQFDYVCFRLT